MVVTTGHADSWCGPCNTGVGCASRLAIFTWPGYSVTVTAGFLPYGCA
jgi:hypothetical protein